MSCSPSPSCNGGTAPQKPAEPPAAGTAPSASAAPISLSDSPARGFLSPATAKAQQEKKQSKAQLALSAPAKEGHGSAPPQLEAPGMPPGSQGPRATAHNSDCGVELSKSCDLATTK